VPAFAAVWLRQSCRECRRRSVTRSSEAYSHESFRTTASNIPRVDRPVTPQTALALIAGGCGSSSATTSSPSSSASSGAASSSGASSAQPGSIHFAKTKFVLHVGLAFGAFHRYIYKPFRAGVFGKPLSHKAALVKGALATAFIIHELKIAYTDAQSSPILSKLVSPITALMNKIDAMTAQFKAGRYDPSQIKSAQSDVASISTMSDGAGAVIKDLPVPAF